MIELIQSIINQKLFDALDMSTVDIASDTQSIQSITCYAVQAYWDSFTGNGTERIITEGSNDAINWSTLDSFIPTGTTNSRMLNVEKAGYAYVRIHYTCDGGAVGNLTTRLSGKVI